MAKNSQGDTPLHLALSSNKLNVAMDLLKVGSVNVLSLVNNSQESPLHIFLRYCAGTHPIPNVLLEEGVLNLQGLHMAQGDGIGAKKKGVLLELLKYTPTLCIRDVNGQTPLLIAAQQGCVLAVQLIVSHCPQSAEICDPEGRTVLHLLKNLMLKVNTWEMEAVDFPSVRSYKEVKELLSIPEINALKDRKDCHGNTPAHAALGCQAFVLAKVLMECLADFTILNKNGDSALTIIESLPDFPIQMEELRVTEKSTRKGMDIELLQAALEEDVSLFKKKGGRDVESGEIKYDDDYFLSQTLEGSSILHLAANSGHLKFIEEAVKHFPTLVLTTDCSGETPLHCASRLKSNHLVATTLLRLTKETIDKFKEQAGGKLVHALPWRQKNSKGNMPLHEAICSSNYDAAIALLHVDPKLFLLPNRTGETPLHILARYGAYTTMDKLENLIDLLMGQNGSLIAYTRDADGFTPLLRAAYCGRFLVAYHLVMLCPASIKFRDPYGRIFLHHLRVVSNAEIDATNDMFYAFESILPLLTKDLRSAQDCDGNTPLHFALIERNFAAAKFLLLCCIEAQVRTELTITNNMGHSVLDLLAALAADIPGANELKDLGFLAQRKLKEAARSIKMMSAEVYRGAVNGKVGLFYWCSDMDPISGAVNDSAFLSQAPDGSNILHIAIQHGQEAFVEEAIKRYPDLIFEVDCNGNTPLHIASMFYEGDFKHLLACVEDHCVKKFQESYREPFMPPWRVKNSKGNTPLHEAMQSILSCESCEALLLTGPEMILSVNDAGETPLHVFARHGLYDAGEDKIDTLEMLLSQNGSAAYTRDKEGLTPLLRAAKTGRLLVALIILKYYPQSIQLRDLNGRSFLHLLHFTGFEVDESLDEKLAYAGMAKPFFRIPEVDFLRNAVDFDGNTPLLFAIKEGNSFNAKFIAQRFMETDEDDTMGLVVKRNNEGQNVLDLLALHDDAPDEVLRLLEKKGRFEMTFVRSTHGIRKTQIKEMANTLSVVAALLATLTFAAAYQVPGGYDDGGTPILLRKAAFQVFIISNTCALCGSMAVLFSLLWVMSTGKTADSFLLLDLSISLLLISFNATLVAFMTGIYVALSHKTLWLAVFICVVCSTVIALMRKSIILRITRFLRLFYITFYHIKSGNYTDAKDITEGISRRARLVE
ncbi:uncharacterized protein [Spinacia oleracea]|uniref:PGG domain-containing protein n=1 Tax=Spinacia oleracea TaxID=3562 RepID=A0A9R0JUY3_SPIOL|nr:uncharacterized protein LOC110787719 [Spinacia oleracea]